MSVLRTNVDFAKRIFADRVGNDYVYGGNWDPNDTSVGTDCSGLVIDILDACVNGTRMAWSRHGMSTESWRPIEVGEVGPFGTICVASPADFPPDAVVKVALHHGPGGGANSHMWCECDGIRMESNGSDGAVTGSDAMSVYDTSYPNDWAYLPGPIVDAGGQPSPGQTVMTVPLTSVGGGRWTSPSPAWAHLIMRESGGNPTIIQQIIDVNSGGNEAEGLFQITPKTWAAHRGTEFAPSARHATPQQQAIVAARILTRNPSGSDWGAGLPGRENAAELAAGLISTTAGEGFLMALTDAQQQEIYDKLCGDRVSRSPLRHVGEGPIGDIEDLTNNIDGSVHLLVMHLLAVVLRSPDALALVQEVAATTAPDRQNDRKIAQAFLNEIVMIDAARGQQSSPDVAKAVVESWSPTVTEPNPSGDGVSSAVSALKSALTDITTQLRS